MQKPGTEPANLEAQYDEALGFLRALLAQRQRVVWRMSPLRTFTTSLRVLRAIFRQDLLSSRVPAEARDVLLRLATPDERKNVAFTTLASEYPNHAIAVELMRRFPSTDFAKLKRLHDIKTKALAFLGPVTVTGFVLGISTSFLKQVPKSVIEGFGVDYVNFETTVFIWTVIVLGYLFAVLLPVWIKQLIALQGHRLFAYLLEYCSMESGGTGGQD